MTKEEETDSFKALQDPRAAFRLQESDSRGKQRDECYGVVLQILEKQGKEGLYCKSHDCHVRVNG